MEEKNWISWRIVKDQTEDDDELQGEGGDEGVELVGHKDEVEKLKDSDTYGEPKTIKLKMKKQIIFENFDTDDNDLIILAEAAVDELEEKKEEVEADNEALEEKAGSEEHLPDLEPEDEALEDEEQLPDLELGRGEELCHGCVYVPCLCLLVKTDLKIKALRGAIKNEQGKNYLSGDGGGGGGTLRTITSGPNCDPPTHLPEAKNTPTRDATPPKVPKVTILNSPLKVPLVVQGGIGESLVLRSNNLSLVGQLVSELFKDIIAGLNMKATPVNKLRQSSLSRYWGNKSSPGNIKALIKSAQSSSSRNSPGKLKAKIKSAQPRSSSSSAENIVDYKVRIQEEATGNKSPEKLPSDIKANIIETSDYKANQAQLSLKKGKLVINTARVSQECEAQISVTPPPPQANKIPPPPIPSHPPPTIVNPPQPITVPPNQTNQPPNPTVIPPKTEKKIGRRLSSQMLEKYESMLGGKPEPTPTHRLKPTQSMESANQPLSLNPRPTTTIPSETGAKPKIKLIYHPPHPHHPQPNPTPGNTGVNLRLKRNNIMPVSTPSPIRKRRKKLEIEIETNKGKVEGRKLGDTLKKWLELEKKGADNIVVTGDISRNPGVDTDILVVRNRSDRSRDTGTCNPG